MESHSMDYDFKLWHILEVQKRLAKIQKLVEELPIERH